MISVPTDPSVPPWARLLCIELSRNTAALKEVSAAIRVMGHDVRSTREKVNVIEARTPYRTRRRKKVARG
jgi:hypothetical protein